MAPVSAPLPTPRNLPFQCALSGIHNSVWMLESAVGVSLVVTLQNGKGADTVMVGAVAPLLFAVVVNGAVMSIADVTVPSSRLTPIRLLHAVAATGVRAVITIAVDRAAQKRSGIANTLNCFMISSNGAAPAELGRQPRGSLQQGEDEINDSNDTLNPLRNPNARTTWAADRIRSRGDAVGLRRHARSPARDLCGRVAS